MILQFINNSAVFYIDIAEKNNIKTMLYHDRWSQDNQTELVLSETTECQSVFDKFLRFFYTADISVTVDTSVGILCLADKYCVGNMTFVEEPLEKRFIQEIFIL
jgi:hypothetical protein